MKLTVTIVVPDYLFTYFIFKGENCMAELLKHRYNKALIKSLCGALVSEYPSFDHEKFNDYVFDELWEGKELKTRMLHVSSALYEFLPMKYEEALQILKPVSSNFSGFEFMIFPSFVEIYGFLPENLDQLSESIKALEYFTAYSSSEFAVRPFIQQYPERMMVQMAEWARSPNEHVRRLSTEGCRPRLPWAMALPMFKEDPDPVLSILELLKDDNSVYVRRSVANNLNDISKDHPQLVINVARAWQGLSKETDWVVKHACRTLLKQGEPNTMALFGFSEPKHIRVDDFYVQDSLKMGGGLQFSFTLSSQKTKLGKLRVEYAIDFVKNNGKLARKVFCISESENNVSQKVINKTHSFKKISTRKYYSGKHSLAIIVNGYELGSGQFELQV